MVLILKATCTSQMLSGVMKYILNSSLEILEIEKILTSHSRQRTGVNNNIGTSFRVLVLFLLTHCHNLRALELNRAIAACGDVPYGIVHYVSI